MRLEATSDLWWKNAIIYCVDTQAFLDSSGDGVGDLDGLTQRIDYLAGLGVTCLWLMPIYPSPERDYGYDVADYYNVANKYGSLGDMVELIRTARERGIRVIADLVVNHTSIDHPWFQLSRKGDPRFKDFYVWADEKPANADDGVIFPGKQKGIWSYDRAARRWYMHRFYWHQPDLNINNPDVRNEIQKVVGYWLELGLSGFRVDAVPFVIEQVDPDHPAVKDPHDYLRDLGDFMTRRRGDAMFLAEANEPKDKIGHYFGERGNEMDMLFSFITNEALYLSFVRHDATPVADALQSPAAHPAAGAVGELHQEPRRGVPRQADRCRARRGVRRLRSAQVDAALRARHPTAVSAHGRRRSATDGACLLAALLAARHAGPVLRRGDRPGRQPRAMPDRAAIRLPMQWSPDANGGFSTADPDELSRQPLRDGPFGYRKVNVEDQRRDPHSFLNWMERAIRTRKEWPEFGWGDWRVLGTRNSAGPGARGDLDEGQRAGGAQLLVGAGQGDHPAAEGRRR